MAGIKLIGTFLIAGLLCAGTVCAEGNPDRMTGSPGPAQAFVWNELAAQPAALFGVPTVATEAEKPSTGPAAVKTALADIGAKETAPQAGNPPQEAGPESEEGPEIGEPGEAIEEVTIADPIEPWNRMMYQFNDKLYFWALKPVAKGYNTVVPEPVRVSVNNFFKNVAMPVRFLNSLLQLKLKSAGTELARFGINTTIGIAGFFDIARDDFEIYEQNRDMGQTLGIYGMPGMMYIVWPFLGPSTIRDSIGFAGDSFLDASAYLDPFYVPLALHAYDRINKTSLDLTSYDDLKKASVEPYTAMRDAYIQYRKGQINK